MKLVQLEAVPHEWVLKVGSAQDTALVWWHLTGVCWGCAARCSGTYLNLCDCIHDNTKRKIGDGNLSSMLFGQHEDLWGEI